MNTNYGLKGSLSAIYIGSVVYDPLQPHQVESRKYKGVKHNPLQTGNEMYYDAILKAWQS